MAGDSVTGDRDRRRKNLFFVAVRQTQLHKALKQLTKIQADGSGFTRHKAGRGHAGQRIDLQKREALIRAKNEVCPAVAPEAKHLVRGQGQLLHARR